MGKGRKTKKRRHHATTAAAPPPNDTESLGQGRHFPSVTPPVLRFHGHWKWLGAVFSLFVGLALALLLCFAKITFERSDTGAFAEEAVEGWLQVHLTNRDPHSCCVVVVDISDIPKVNDPFYGNRSTTSRSDVEDVIKKVAQADPAAIGIDLEFSPDSNGDISFRDEQFLRACMNLNGPNGHIPVFVGIFAWSAAEKQHQLGEEGFGDLAAFSAVPQGEGILHNHRMPRAIAFDGNSPTPSMSSVLSDAFLVVHPRSSPKGLRSLSSKFNALFPWFLEQFPTVRRGRLQATEFELNLGPLFDIENETVPYGKVLDRAKQLKGKVVLIGKTNRPESLEDDAPPNFALPGTGRETPGVYIEATAATNLITGPLWTVTPAGEILADCIFTLITITLLIACELWIPWGWAKEMVLPFTIAAVFMTGLSVAETGVLWSGFLIATIVLLLHRLLERKVEPLKEKIIEGVMKIWKHS